MTPFTEAERELSRAIELHPRWPVDPIHAFAIVQEEIGEAQKALIDYVYHGKGTREEIRTEAIQAMATLARFIDAIDNAKYEYKDGYGD